VIEDEVGVDPVGTTADSFMFVAAAGIGLTVGWPRKDLKGRSARENDDRKRKTIDDGLRVFVHDMVWTLRV